MTRPVNCDKGWGTEGGGLMWDDSRFWDRIAGKYAQSAIADEASYQRKLAITRDYLGPEAEVLELGCGTGSTALAHAPYAKHILATDISSAMLEIARDRAAAAGIANVTFRQSALETLEAPAESFDAVLCLSILHLVEDRPGAIRKAAGFLRPGGVLVSSTACLNDGMRALALVLPVVRAIGKAPRVGFFSAEALRADMRAAGLDIVEDWRPRKRAALFLVARKPG